MKAHLRESWAAEKASKNTCLGRRSTFSEPPTHLREILSSPLSNSAKCPNTRVVSPPPCAGSTTNDSGVCLLEAIRQFVAAWEQHNRYIPRSECPEEWAARKAARDALAHLEDSARWLEAEMETGERQDRTMNCDTEATTNAVDCHRCLREWLRQDEDLPGLEKCHVCTVRHLRGNMIEKLDGRYCEDCAAKYEQSLLEAVNARSD